MINTQHSHDHAWMCLRTEARASPKPREYPAGIHRAPERDAPVLPKRQPPPVQRRLEHPSA